jgi:putative oxidoreductase
VLRIVVGFTFAAHGAQKLFGFFGGMQGSTAPMFSLFWFAGVIEFFGGVLIFLGLFTQPVAFLICGEMAVAYFRTHFPRGLWPIQNGGELAVLYCFINLYFFTSGPGPVSLDALRSRK